MVKNKKASLLVSLALLSLLFSIGSPLVETVTADHLAEPTSAQFQDTTGTIIVTFSDGVRTEFSADFFEEDFSYVPLGAYGGIIGGSACASYIDNVNTTTNPATGTLYAYTDTDGQPNSVSCNEHQTFAISASEGNLDDPTNPEGEEEAAITCESQSGALGWLACPIVNFLIETAEFGANILESLLQVRPLIPDQADPVFKIWENVRDVGLLLLVIATLGLIFSEALSLNVSQLTVKRMLPRLVTAAIGVVLSFYLVAIAVDFFNVMGGSIKSLLESALADNGIQVGIGEAITAITGSLVVVFGAGAALISLGVIGFMTFVMLPVVLGILVTLFTVVFRQVIIVALAVFAPVALAAWVLPNTEKYFKQWWDLLVKALFMYPLIMILITSGTIFASILTNESTGTNVGFLNFLLAMVAIVLPLFLVPATFKAAGGVVGRIAGLAGDRSRGPIDRLRNAGKERTEQRKNFRQNQARVQMGRDSRAGKKSSLPTRMRAGSLFRGGDSLRGQLARQEMITGAMDPRTRMDFLQAKAEDDEIKAEQLRMRSYSPGQLLGEGTKQGASDAAISVAFKKLTDMGAYAQTEFEQLQDHLYQQGQKDLGYRLTQESAGSLKDYAPHRLAFNWSTGQPTYSAVASKKAEDIVKVSPKSIQDSLIEAQRLASTGNEDDMNTARSIVQNTIEGYAVAMPQARDRSTAANLVELTESGTFEIKRGKEDIRVNLGGVVNQIDSDPNLPGFVARANEALRNNVQMQGPTPTPPPSTGGSGQSGSGGPTTGGPAPSSGGPGGSPSGGIGPTPGSPGGGSAASTMTTETEYNIERPGQSGGAQSSTQTPSSSTPSTPEEQARRTFGPRSPYAGGRTSPGQHSSNEPIDPSAPPSEEGRHLRPDQSDNQENSEGEA